MAPLVTTPESSHWYLPNGTPFYEVPNKSKPGEFRPATIRDARKVNAVPSVTSILKVIHKPQLENWKQEQAILSALTLPRLDGETDDAFARRVVVDSRQQASDAADLGSRIHDSCERWLMHRDIPVDETQAAIRAFAEWWDAEGECPWPATECPFAANGYGGRIDMIATDTVLDIKTKDTDDIGKVYIADDWALQLAAYAKAVGVKRRINVILTTRGDVKAHEWPVEELEADYAAFQAAFTLWKWQHDWENQA